MLDICHRDNFPYLQTLSYDYDLHMHEPFGSGYVPHNEEQGAQGIPYTASFRCPVSEVVYPTNGSPVLTFVCIISAL